MRNILEKSGILTILALLVFINHACKPTAQSIVDECIEVYGGKKYDDLDVAFDFRNMHYTIKNINGKYTYTRIQIDSSGHKIEDVVTNDSFERKIDGVKTSVPDSMATKYTSSVNSVAYFFLLPKPLNDPAVSKELVGTSKIKGKEYDKIKVKFSEEGGGKDHQDVFMYWIEKKSKSMDYFAYSYETNGGGIRFREAFNQKTQNGIKYSDYRNYGFEDLNTKLENLDVLFGQNKIPLKSEIINLNVIIK
ncbi:DUF6503 family protein [Lacihabitans soyangensis]|uniref:Deoxyribose-phosphate aldolase n=1 Tax=Lacihabitans soyangensis TaxID=869394 RepID=A0AAE3H0W4_9BACT|nr:DUF6503 family protein [Lacihabitans soyangensis]MCP9762245.1 deoxyribose-phosphate aldolase [Lacihabitans soyangensis]